MGETMVKGLIFKLRGQGSEIELALDAQGRAERLSYRFGDDVREFPGEEIEVVENDEGTRATVLLATGAADGPVVHLTVIVPTVILGDEGSFEVSAAALHTTQRSLFGGPRPGPQQSYDALKLGGTVACSPQGTPNSCRDWYASHDHMPPGPATLRVTGTCSFGTTGYKVELRPHEPQGVNPKDLLLDKIVTPPAGLAGQAFTEVAVVYEQVTDFEYDSVTILPDGPSIPVEDVH